MNATGYIINSILVLLVLRQIRETRLDLANLVLPVLLVGAAAAYYLHSVPTAGHDVLLDVTLGAVGLALGALCALATRLRRGPDGIALAKAGIVAAVLWMAGIGARMAFSLWSGHGGAPHIASFSIAHQITGAGAWVAALVIMALAEVLARLGILRLRARMLPCTGSAGTGPSGSGLAYGQG
ncbi:MAG TPA: hypothetical protein VGQ05_21225 [Streptosporangiaceae bacterium]|nr:hypothetical protein [Streptosporangiaceae bacterium]